ncbi:MAG TPA: ribonuclease domain-containing protein [Verrucomicrobiae bacterium]|nr:ribonuclease domain-containing protein [Verrucomicrobiae bacterium]
MKRIIFAISLLLVLIAYAGGQQWLGGGTSPQPSAGTAATSPAPDAAAASVPSAALARFGAEERSAIASALALIADGGPFLHKKDGSVFQNREGRLPRYAAGYYREYTVETPNSADRGARRIVTGAGGEIYYTADHYNNFVQLK